MKCWICKRTFNSNDGRFPVSGPSNHHIIPKEYKHRKKFKNEKESICKACHLQINRMFTNKELLNMTTEELKNHPKTKTWIKWIRKE